MKTTLKITGAYELDNKDIMAILLDTENRKSLTPMISQYIVKKYGYAPKSIQYPKDGLDRVVCIIDHEVDGGAKPLGTVRGEQSDKASTEGHTKVWRGLYEAIGEVIDAQRKRKKDFISWEDLRAELLEMETDRGQKLFIKDGQELPMGIIKHRMAPSQMVRQAKNQSNLRGIKQDKKNGGLKWG